MRIFNLVYGICLWDISMEDIEFTHKIISMDILKLTTLDMIDMIYIYQVHQINKFLI
jgi:hypothetical protein